MNRILALRGKLRPGVPDKAPDRTELRLRLDRVLFGLAQLHPETMQNLGHRGA